MPAAQTTIPAKASDDLPLAEPRPRARSLARATHVAVDVDHGLGHLTCVGVAPRVTRWQVLSAAAPTSHAHVDDVPCGRPRERLSWAPSIFTTRHSPASAASAIARGRRPPSSWSRWTMARSTSGPPTSLRVLDRASVAASSTAGAASLRCSTSPPVFESRPLRKYCRALPAPRLGLALRRLHSSARSRRRTRARSGRRAARGSRVES
jgi:hypothetical protein